MGFSSWDCKGCGESVKAPYDLPPQIAWQNELVAILPDETMLEGVYDGYGRMTSSAADGLRYFLITLPGWGELQPQVWHKRCHADAGAPQSFTGPSESAADQGYFYSRNDT